jgi:predicted transcriptional regulator
MSTATLSRKAPAEPRDRVLEEIRRLMAEKNVAPKEIIESTGFSKNTVYETLSGKRRMHERNAQAILIYLAGKKVKKKSVRVGSPSADN